MTRGRSGMPSSGPERGTRAAWLSLALLFACGAAVRLLSGVPVFHADLVYSPVRDSGTRGSGTPGDAVKTFYLAVDGGEYSKAFSVSIEPDWTGPGGTVSFFDGVGPGLDGPEGWTTEEAFVRRLKEELGAYGYGIRLNSIEVIRCEERADRSFLVPLRLEGSGTAYTVAVTGHILGACTIFRWEKTLTVLGTGGGYKVLLEGTKEPKKFFYQAWFSNIEKFGSIKG